MCYFSGYCRCILFEMPGSAFDSASSARSIFDLILSLVFTVLSVEEERGTVTKDGMMGTGAPDLER